MDDLIQRLRASHVARGHMAAMGSEPMFLNPDGPEAITIIESLQSQVEELRGALEPFAACVDQIDPEESDEEWAKFRLLISDFRRARQALERSKRI